MNPVVIVVVAVVVLLALLGGLYWFLFLRGEGGGGKGPLKTSTINGVKVDVMKLGDGATAKNGSTVHVNYTGKLTSGKVFDSSDGKGKPLSFKLGTGRVIKGWELGLDGMKVGEKRVLTIPPNLAYGTAGKANVIPPDSTLIFDVELVKVE